MKFLVKVNATSANVGAGFDCVGLALDFANEIVVSDETDRELEIVSAFAERDERSLIYRSMKRVFDLTGKKVNRLKIEQTDRIPMASGLGSSAACVTAGAVAANALVGNPLAPSEIINLCAAVDGHPDNVLPAILGGIVAGVMTKSGVEYVRSAIDEKLCAVALTPDFPLFTHHSRSVLPNSYSREDVVFSLSRAVLGFGAFCLGDIEKLRCLDDRLHQPYRIPLIRGYDEAVSALRKSGAICTFLSGAGPTVLGVYNGAPSAITPPEGYTARVLKFSSSPIKVERID